MRYKLISNRGTLLGTLDVPDNVSRYLDEHRWAEAAYFSGMRALAAQMFGPDVSPTISIRKIILECDWEYRDGVRLHGDVTLEELEKVPGWHFAPSAAYMRSLITEGGDE